MDGPIQRQRLADQAYEVIKNMILTRQLVPGQRLSVPQLAEQLDLSRSPIREAVQRLVSEGLGVDRVRRGAEVTRFDLSALREIYAVREVLEGLAAATAACLVPVQLKMVLPTISEHIRAHREAIRANDDVGIIGADLGFHRAVLAAAGNSHLERALNPMFGRAQIAMLSGDLSAWPRKALAEHRQILAAIRAGDGERAESVARQHVRSVFERHTTRVGSGAESDLEYDGAPADLSG